MSTAKATPWLHLGPAESRPSPGAGRPDSSPRASPRSYSAVDPADSLGPGISEGRPATRIRRMPRTVRNRSWCRSPAGLMRSPGPARPAAADRAAPEPPCPDKSAVHWPDPGGPPEYWHHRSPDGGNGEGRGPVGAARRRMTCGLSTDRNALRALTRYRPIVTHNSSKINFLIRRSARQYRVATDQPTACQCRMVSPSTGPTPDPHVIPPRDRHRRILDGSTQAQPRRALLWVNAPT